MTYSLGSLCAGVGGFDLAFERSGFECRWAVEIDEMCRNVLRRHFSNTKLHEDVKNVTGALLGGVDVVTYGFPCTDLSVAGKRQGMVNAEGERTRSGLFYDCLRVITEVKPRVAIFENVPGLLSHDGGETFRGVIASLGEAGYDTTWVTLDSRFFGVPQRRRRVFGISTRKTERGLGEAVLAKIQLIPQSLRRDSAEGREAREGVASSTGNRSAEYRVSEFGETSPTVTSKWHKGTGGPSGSEFDNLTVSAIDCRNDKATDESNTLHAKHASSLNHINPIVIRTANTGANGHGVADDEAHTIDRAKGQAVCHYADLAATVRSGGCGGVPSSRGENVVALHQTQDPINNVEMSHATVAGSRQWCATSAVAIHQNASGEVRESDEGYAVSTNSNPSGRNTGMVSMRESGKGYWMEDDQTGTLDKNMGDSGHEKNRPATIAQQSIVRRLTPVECCRLQAFPDDWNEWGVDENGKRVSMSDSTRYKQMGNAVTVNVIEFLAKRIIKPALDFVDA